MKLVEENEVENDRKLKKTIRIMVIAIVSLIIISIILFVSIYYLKEQLFKFEIDGKTVDMPTTDLFMYDEDTIYVSLSDMAHLVDYTYYKGGYKEYTEDKDKCYLVGSNEICIMEAGEKTIYKTPLDKIDYEYFEIDQPIKEFNNKLYITSNGLQVALNLRFRYDEQTNTTTIFTLPYFVNYYSKNNKFAAVDKNFNNQKALLYNLLVTKSESKNSRDVYYGISNLKGEELVGKKYTDINFIESAKEFIVKTSEGKVGIIASDGEPKVSPQYDNITQIDKNLNLYLVESGSKKGVVEKNGKILIYPEYDRIGIDSTLYQGNNIKNPYLLLNNLIPVQQDGKWGMYDIKGNLVVDLEYDGMGCTANNNQANNIIIIPDIKAIVVAKNYGEGNNRKTTYYGLVNYLGRLIIPAGLQRIYATVSSGRTEYFMEHEGTTYEAIKKIKDIVPKLDELNDESKANKTTEEIQNN